MFVYVTTVMTMSSIQLMEELVSKRRIVLILSCEYHLVIISVIHLSNCLLLFDQDLASNSLQVVKESILLEHRVDVGVVMAQVVPVLLSD